MVKKDLTSPEWPLSVARHPLEFFMSLSLMSQTLIVWSAPPLNMYGPLADIARITPSCPLEDWNMVTILSRRVSTNILFTDGPAIISLCKKEPFSQTQICVMKLVKKSKLTINNYVPILPLRIPPPYSYECYECFNPRIGIWYLKKRNLKLLNDSFDNKIPHLPSLNSTPSLPHLFTT